MSWTPEQRRRYAPAINEAVRANATVRPAATIDPPAWAGAAWPLLPAGCPLRQTVGSRLKRWVRPGVLDSALAVLDACVRLARGRDGRPSAGILDTRSVRTGP